MPADPQQHGSTTQLCTSVGHKLKTLSSEVSKFVPNLVVHAKPVIKLTDLLSLVVDAVLAQRRQTEDVLLERTCLP